MGIVKWELTCSKKVWKTEWWLKSRQHIARQQHCVKWCFWHNPGAEEGRLEGSPCLLHKLENFCNGILVLKLRRKSSVTAAVVDGWIAIKTGASSPLSQMLCGTGGWRRCQCQVFSRCPSPTSFTHHQAWMHQEVFSQAAGSIIPEKQLWLLIGDF